MSTNLTNNTIIMQSEDTVEKAASVVLEFSLDVEEITTEENNSGALSGWRVEKDEVLVEYVTYKLQRMHIYDEKKKRENELVLYRGSDAIVPFEAIKKRIQRLKVDLDPETDRLWRVLIGKEGSEGGGGDGGGENLEKDKEKWWENERRVFHGCADSLIARMHLV
ncbi:unnamed protein product [Lactuca saligna]|uniref:Uncharacterized protein n=1 Tax=Lactuca saligna TaxID=75948 RepID=A0AA35Z6Y7_LACSI|nr:unnamed protein product [Lactuca saligna]